MSEESTPKEGMTTEDIGTTERLFGVQVDDAEAPPEEVVEESHVKEPEVIEKPIDEYLSEADFNKKLKTKVDGEEREETLAEILKGYQTAQHLSKKGQKIAEERRALEELRKSLAGMTPQGPIPNEPLATMPPDDPFYKETIEPYLKPLVEANKSLQAKVDELNTITQEVRYQNNLKQIDKMLKEQGYSDFMEYVPQIEAHIAELEGEAFNTYNTMVGYYDLFKDFKIKELASGKPKVEPKKAEPEVKQAKIIKIEGGQGTPTGSDDWLATYNAAFDKAKKTNDTEDWMKVLILKGAVK